MTVEYKLSDSDLLRSGGEIQQYQLDDWWPPSGTGPMMSPNTFWNIRDGERDRYALFSEWQAGWGEQWLTLAGVRYEAVRMDSRDVRVTARCTRPMQRLSMHRTTTSKTITGMRARGAVYPSPTQTWEIGLARKTRSPNLYERYTWSTVGMAMRMVNLAGDGNGYVGNLDLDPEVASTMSISSIGTTRRINTGRWWSRPTLPGWKTISMRHPAQR